MSFKMLLTEDAQDVLREIIDNPATGKGDALLTPNAVELIDEIIGSDQAKFVVGQQFEHVYYNVNLTKQEVIDIINAVPEEKWYSESGYKGLLGQVKVDGPHEQDPIPFNMIDNTTAAINKLRIFQLWNSDNDMFNEDFENGWNSNTQFLSSDGKDMGCEYLIESGDTLTVTTLEYFPDEVNGVLISPEPFTIR